MNSNRPGRSLRVAFSGSLRWGGLSLVLSLGLVACTGEIAGNRERTTGTDAGNGPGQAGATGVLPGVPAASDCAATPPAPMYLRLLSKQEYKSTVKDLLGVEPSVDQLPPDLTLHGFDNNAESLAISVPHVEAYRAVAEGAVAALLADAARRQTAIGCEPSGSAGAACLDSFVRKLGLRAFRRPLLDQEVSSLLTLAATAPATEGTWGGVGRVIEGLLQAPSFLFRVEVGQPDLARPGLVRLTGHELAARLSYLVWGTTPDDRLLEAASSGGLDTSDGIAVEALGMLEDVNRARPTLWSFAGQWLRVRNLAQTNRDSAEFPEWTDSLRAAMVEETRRVVEDYTSRPGVPVLGLFDSKTTFVDATLASFYGVAAPPANQWAQVTLPAAQGRVGVLTHASILTLTARGVTTPILRGKFIREVLLCDALPAPPPNAPPIDESPAQQDLGERVRLASHRSNPACSGCHELLEPLGFGLSHFDAIGAYRESDKAGRPIDASGNIAGLADASFDGSAALVERLSRDPRLGECLATHLVRFALGRKEADGDRCAIGQLNGVLQKGGDFRTLVQTLVGSDAFRYRLPADADPDQGGLP